MVSFIFVFVFLFFRIAPNSNSPLPPPQPYHNQQIFKTAINIGYNPTYRYKNPIFTKVIEPHLLHSFGEGVVFDGAGIKLVIAGYVRPEINFRYNTEALHDCIAKDVEETAAALEEPEFQEILEQHKAFLTENGMPV